MKTTPEEGFGERLKAARVRARAWAEVYRLPFRNRVWRGQVGEFAGAGVGGSLDFQDHRAYLPGDDPRHINWQAYARTGTYSMKLYREEVRPVVDLVLDVSDSMSFRPDKEERVWELFLFCAEAAWRVGASVRASLVRGEKCTACTDDELLSEGWLAARERVASGDPSAAPALARVALRAGSLRVLVSDLLFPGTPDGLLMVLASRRGRGIVLAPYNREEEDPGWAGNYDFIDAESGRRHPHRVEPALLQRYLQAYARHFAVWKESAIRHGVLLCRVAAHAGFRESVEADAMAQGALERWM